MYFVFSLSKECLMARAIRFPRSRNRCLSVHRLEDRSLPSSVQGTVFTDANRNGVFDTGETGLAGWTVYVDTNQDARISVGEPTAVTDGNGNYFFDTTANPSTYYVALDLQVGSGGRW